MTSESENQIVRIIKYALPLFILISAFVVLIILYYEKTKFFEKEKLEIKQNYIEKNKLIIKEQIYNVYNYILTEQLHTENDLKKSLKTNLTIAHTIASSIYERNKNKDKDEVKRIIIEALRDIRFNDGRGYFFIYDMNAKNIMLPTSPHLENKDFNEHKDAKGKFIIKEMVNTLKKQNEAFFNWYWYKPNTYEKQLKKIGIARTFEPFGWFIGTGEYIEDFEKEVQKKILKYIHQISFAKNGYVFILDYDFNYLNVSEKEKTFLENNKITENKILVNFLDIAKNGEDFYTYKENENENKSLKTSFIKGLQNWSWILGAGFYEEDVENQIKLRKNELNKKFEEYINNTIILTILLTIFFIMISISFSNRLKKLFNKHRKEIKNHIHLNNQQQHILAQQSKMAAMGEMIGNIAHQWRQPLSVITSSASLIKLKKELNIIEEKDYNESIESIMESANYLSNTIDDFRYFFLPNKEKNKFNSLKLMNKLNKFVQYDFERNSIQIISNIEDIEIFTFESELIQVLLNILNNAKDELIKKKDKNNRFVFIDFFKENNEIKINIKDNASGIKEEIINRIFEPYFTTKHKSKGTGIGLFMSSEIIKKHMQGNIEVRNIHFEYEKKQNIGAEFKISFPTM